MIRPAAPGTEVDAAAGKRPLLRGPLLHGTDGPATPIGCSHGGVGRPKNITTTCLYERTTLLYIALLGRRTHSPSTQAAVPERVIKYGAVAECQHEVEDQKRGVLHIKCQAHRA